MSDIGKFIGSVLGSSGFGNAVGALGTIGSLIGGASQRSSQERINEMNIALQRETNALQESMFNKNLAWQRESQAIQNEFNSIGNQVRQAIEAGVNPMAVTGQTSSGVGSSGSSIPALSAPHAQMIDSSSRNTISNISDIAKAISDISNSNLSEAQKNEINSTLEERIKALHLNNEQTELANKILSIDLKFKNKRSQVEYDNLVKDLAVKASEIQLNSSLDDKAQSESLHELENAFLVKTKNLIAKKDYVNYEERFRNEMRVLQSQVKLNNSGANANVAKAAESYAHANLFNEQSMTEETVRDVNRSLEKMNNAIGNLNQVRTEFERRTLGNRILQEFEKLTNQRYLNQSAKYDVETARAHMEQALYNNDMKAFTYWSNFGFELVDRGINAVNAVKGLPVTPWSHQTITPQSGNMRPIGFNTP